ncbi:MAG TPA: PadR family transcriptional regulator [Acidobacteria bacterium]|nr:PadR family transcriptional regulator [Acidobacteriota bacterium]
MSGCATPLDNRQERPVPFWRTPRGGQVTKSRTDLLQGTLDLLVLKTLSTGARHGWGISQRIHQMSKDVLQVNQGSLYPALHRLEQQGWIRARWGKSENNRQAKYYELTPRGRRQLDEEIENWVRLSTAVAGIVEV